MNEGMMTNLKTLLILVRETSLLSSLSFSYFYFFSKTNPNFFLSLYIFSIEHFHSKVRQMSFISLDFSPYCWKPKKHIKTKLEELIIQSKNNIFLPRDLFNIRWSRKLFLPSDCKFIIVLSVFLT